MTRKKKPHTTREGWLQECLLLLKKEFFDKNGYEFPEKWAIAPSFSKNSPKAIGQCWDPKVSADGETHQILICLTQGADLVHVAQIVLHEMIHASVGIKEGHKGMFRKLALEFGMAGKMTATYAEPGSELHEKLELIVEKLGAYPHVVMDPKKKATKKTNGWVRYRSTTEETYTVQVSPKKVEEFGAPLDPWGEQMELV